MGLSICSGLRDVYQEFSRVDAVPSAFIIAEFWLVHTITNTLYCQMVSFYPFLCKPNGIDHYGFKFL